MYMVTGTHKHMASTKITSPPPSPPYLHHPHSAPSRRYFPPKGALHLLNHKAKEALGNGEAIWPPCGAGRPHH